MSINNKVTLVACAVSTALTLSGCGSDSTSETPKTGTIIEKPTESSIDITVIDGYIRGAIAFADLNLNGIKDSGEPDVITGEGGRGTIVTTSLDIDLEKAVIVVDIPAGAVDEDTITESNPDGIPVTEETAYQLISLPGETIATPLTTLISITAAADASGELTADDINVAKEKVAQSLGLTEEEVIADYIENKNDTLADVARLMIENSVIPKVVTQGVKATDILVASVVTEKIATAVSEAKDTSESSDELVKIIAETVTKSTRDFVEENRDALTDGTADNFAAVVEVVSQASVDAFEKFSDGSEDITQAQLESARVHAQVSSAVIAQLLVEEIEEAPITGEVLLAAKQTVEVTSESVLEQISGMTGSAGTDDLTLTDIINIAVTTGQETLEAIEELSKSELTDEELAAALDDLSEEAKIAANDSATAIKNEKAPTENRLPVFGSGEGIDSGEIHAESTEVLTGSLTISDLDDNESGFIEQAAVQGAFGSFSITTSGDWSYSMTNLATGFVSPQEVFSVTSIDGTTHKINVLVKGLYQREVSWTSKSDTGSEIYNEETGQYDIIGPLPVATVAELQDSTFITNVKPEMEADNNLINEYYDTGNYKQYNRYYDGVKYEGSDKNSIYDYEYTNGELSKVLSGFTRYNLDEYGQNTSFISRTDNFQYSITDSQKTERFYELYFYDDFGENAELGFHITYDYIYNELGKISEDYKQYHDTPYRDIDADKEGMRLTAQYFYHDDGKLDYRLVYRATSARLYLGASSAYKYFYDNQGRLSHKTYYSAVGLEDEEGIYDNIYSDIDFESEGNTTFYHYIDELDVIVEYSLDAPNTVETPLPDSVYDFSITQYEDVDQCGDYDIFLYKTEGGDASTSRCRIKTASDMIVEDVINDTPDSIN